MPFKGLVNPEEKNTIHLSNNRNIRLAYTTPNAGENIDMIIDDPTIHKPFELEGEGSENYELDVSSIPPIQGTILPRPVNVKFYPICKVYDGTTDIRGARNSPYLLYTFEPTGEENSGIIQGTGSQRKLRRLKFSKSGYTNILNAMYIIDIPVYKKIDDKSPVYLIANDLPYNYSDSNTYYGDLHALRPGQYEFDAGMSIVSYSIDSIPYSVLDNKYTYTNWIYNPTNAVPTLIRATSKSPLNGRLNLQVTISSYQNITTSSQTATPVGKVYIESDIDKVTVYADSMELTTKEVTNEPNPILFTGLRLAKGIGGDKSSNYKINELVNAYCYIIPKRIGVTVTQDDTKVYDGTTDIGYSVELTGIIEGDDIKISENSAPIIKLNSAKVGSRTVQRNLLPELSGRDAKNYTLDWIKLANTARKTATITARPVWCKCSAIRWLRSQHKLEFMLTLENVIDGDDVKLCSEWGNDWFDFVSERGAFAGAVVSDQYRFDYESYEESDGILSFIYYVECDENSIPFSLLSDASDVSIEIEAYDPEFTDKTKFTVRNGELWSTMLIELTGKDANNYELQNTQLTNIPITIVDIH